MRKDKPFLVSFISILLIGIFPMIQGFFVIYSPLEDFTRNSSNTITLTISSENETDTIVAYVLCNLTSPGGFFCREPIDVSAIVIHDLPPENNLTNLVFLESRDEQSKFFEIQTNSGVYTPRGGMIVLEYSHDFFQGSDRKYVYSGTGEIYYDYEGQFTTTLDFDSEKQTRYDDSNYNFTRPTVVVRPQSDYYQILMAKTNLGLAWIVSGLTVWTILFTVVNFPKVLKKIKKNLKSS